MTAGAVREQGASVGALRHRLPSRLGAGEFAVYLIVALVMISPVTFHLTTRAVGAGDGEYYVWLGWRIGQLILGGSLIPTSIPDVIHPYGNNLLLSDGYLPTYIGGLWNVVAGPILAYNLTIITATLMNIWAARRLAQLFSTDRAVWMITSLAFATAPAIALRSYGHLTMYFAFSAPLIIAEAIRVARGDVRLRPLVVGGLFTVAYLCSIYYLVFGAIAFALIVGIGARHRLKQIVVPLALAVLTVTVLVSPFLVARLSLDRDERAAGAKVVRDIDTYTYSSDLTSVVAQPEVATLEIPGQDFLRGNFSNNVLEGTIFPGFLLLFGGIGGVLLLRNRMKVPLLAASGAIWLFCLGPTLIARRSVLVLDEVGAAARWLPYSLIQALPGLGSLRAPNRASFTLAAVLTAGLALSLGWLYTRISTKRGRVTLVAACGLILATNLVTPVPWSTLDLTARTERALETVAATARKGDTVATVPADCFDPLLRDVKTQIEHQLPMIGCQGNFSSIPWYSEFDRYAKSRGLAAFRCDPSTIGRRTTDFTRRTQPPLGLETLRDLRRRLGVRFYLVDKQFLGSNECRDLPAMIEFLHTTTNRIGEDARWIVFDAGTSDPTGGNS